MDANSPEPNQEIDRIEAVLALERRSRRALLIRVAIVGACVVGCLWITGVFDPRRVANGVPALWTLFTEMLPPDFSRWRQWVKPLIDTVVMSVAGTAMAVALSLPLAFLAAANTTPNRAAFHAARVVLNFFRAIPELIMGIVFVAAVGFGMLPGVLALGLHSIGMVGKFFAETIEHVQREPIEAAVATGATPMQVMTHSILPQAYPKFADITMYRWEYNFRASTVLGMVGAGGIGTELIGSLRLLDYQQVAAILIVILVAVTIVDTLSSMLRRSLT